MAREKFQTLTEQMFYILLALQEERCGADIMALVCGADIMALVAQITQNRVTIGPGTLYNLLEDFLSAGMIMQTKVEGRRRSYVLTRQGKDRLLMEKRRLELMLDDYRHMTAEPSQELRQGNAG